ncbi:hypothetical protein PoB_007108500 [Plakobranchus ocellatus]|uniref:Uncharacterized protein n=1 Tax=Plakobranchus ocellatus TaxID=259542 RepID=A0AAV4DKN7_9GAST|nr:hypothetical protein PoB_007108500 [Plakobranchus ocellatus]
MGWKPRGGKRSRWTREGWMGWKPRDPGGPGQGAGTMGWAGSRGEGGGPDEPEQGSMGRQEWERDGQGKKEVMGKDLSGGGSWGGAIKCAVRHKSPICTVACPY